MNILQSFEEKQKARLLEGKSIPKFAPGDTVRVSIKVVEGARERVQAFEGFCIARKNAGINSSFTLRKVSYGEGVERVFPLYSPNLTNIEVIRHGDVRRAKLYYLRGLTGKKARIAEKPIFARRGERSLGNTSKAASKGKPRSETSASKNEE